MTMYRDIQALLELIGWPISHGAAALLGFAAGLALFLTR